MQLKVVKKINVNINLINVYVLQAMSTLLLYNNKRFDSNRVDKFSHISLRKTAYDFCSTYMFIIK